MLKHFPLRLNDELELRLPNEKMAKSLFHLVEREEAYLKKWGIQLKLIDSIKGAKWHLHYNERANKAREQLISYIFLEGQLIGSVGLMKIQKEHHSAEIGYWIQESMQGRGIVSNCCRAFIQLLFSVSTINRLELRTICINKRSESIAKRLGFTKEGCLRQASYQNQLFYDLDVYGLLKKDFEKQIK